MPEIGGIWGEGDGQRALCTPMILKESGPGLEYRRNANKMNKLVKIEARGF